MSTHVGESAHFSLLHFKSRRLMFVNLYLRLQEMLKRLSHEFFTFFPKRLSTLWIERVPAHSFVYRVDSHMIGNGLANVTVLAISTADLTGGSNKRRPNPGRGALRGGFLLGPPCTLRRQLVIH